MDKKKHRLVEIKLRSMKDEPAFNDEYAEKKSVIACDKALMIILKENENITRSELSSVDGNTLKQLSGAELFRAWIAFTAQLANNDSIDTSHRVFLTHIGNLLRLKQSGIIAFPEGENKAD